MPSCNLIFTECFLYDLYSHKSVVLYFGEHVAVLNEEVWHVLLAQPLLHRLPEVHEPVPHALLRPVHGVLLNHPVEGVADVSFTIMDCLFSK